jgi:hypothetical protein
MPAPVAGRCGLDICGSGAAMAPPVPCDDRHQSPASALYEARGRDRRRSDAGAIRP